MVEITIPLTVVSAITITSTTILIFSFVVWRRVLHKTLNVAIFYTVTSYLLASCGTVVNGQQPDTNAVCTYQGIMSNIFILSSVSWTTMITYLLYSNLKFSKNQHKRIRTPFYVLCFGIPILLTFLPFINATYGSQPGLWRCEMINTSTSPPTAQIFWLWLSFYGWIWFNMLICLLLNVQVMMTLYRAKSTENFKRFKTIVVNYSGYPIIVSLCWLPATITDTLSITHPNTILSDSVLQLSAVMSCSVGLLTTLYFWWTGGKDMIGWWTQFFSSGCDRHVQYKAYSTTDTSISHQSARIPGLSFRVGSSNTSARSRNENGSISDLNSTRLMGSGRPNFERAMRSSMDYSRTAGVRSSTNNFAALTEAVEAVNAVVTDAVADYRSLPASSSSSLSASSSNLQYMGEVPVPVPVLSPLFNSSSIAATTGTRDRELTDKRSVGGGLLPKLPSSGNTGAVDTTYNDNNNIRRKRKASNVNSSAAGLLGVRLAELDNKNTTNTTNTNENNNNNLRRKSSVISSIAGVLGVARVLPVDTTPTVATTPHHTLITPSHTSAHFTEDEKETTGRS